MSDEQKEIGIKLIEIYDKNVDKLYSLIQLAIVVLTLYVAVFVYKTTEIIEALRTNWIIDSCLFSLFTAISFTIFTIQIGHNKKFTIFKENNDFIQFKNENSFAEQNKRLFSVISTQNNTCLSSLLLIICSLGFGCSYLISTGSELQLIKVSMPILCLFLLALSILLRFQREIIATYLHLIKGKSMTGREL